jgi:apolipoprotein N-acyltransferase
VVTPEEKPKTPLGWRTAYALSLATGVLYFLGFPGMDVWPLALVALAPLAVALEGQSPKHGLLLGLLAGFTMNMLGFRWLYGTLNTFGGFPGPVCLFFMSLLLAYQGARIGLFGWLYTLARRRGWPRPLVFFLAFATSELVFPVLFPWYFGNSTHLAPALGQLAEIGGPYLVGLVLAAPSLAVAEAVLARMEKRAVPRRTIAALAAVPAVAALYGAVRIHQVDRAVAASEPVKVGLVQGAIPLVPSRYSRADGMKRQMLMTEMLHDDGADFVVWSEAAVPFSIGSEKYEQNLKRLMSDRLGMPAILGVEIVDKTSTHRHAYNTAVSTNLAGDVTGRYDKHYLLAFGEYLPFGETFPKLYEWSPNSGHLSHGTTLDPLEIMGHRVTALICYEDIIPAFTNAAVRRGRPEMIVNLTNDAWFGDTAEPWIHLALAKMRAVEHRKYVLRATNTGVSAFIDPVGRLADHSEVFRPETVLGTARWMKGGPTGYELFGDVPWWLGAAVTIAMCIRRKHRSADAVSPEEKMA